MIQSDNFEQHIASLLNKANISAKVLALKHCAHGGNNRTYRLETDKGVYVVKKYFRQAADKRDRLACEFSFLSYAKQAAPHFVPIPYSQDVENSIALYEFIDGQPLKVNDITAAEIQQAAQFFCSLNNPNMKRLAEELPLASEARFSICGHLELVGARIHALQQAVADTQEDKNAVTLINDLNSFWQSLVKEIKNSAKADAIDLTAELDHSNHCISPSDFGFHNALKMPDGSLRFLDFEYAGWDDPAKMVGDFFSQLAVPVPAKYFDQFLCEVMAPFSHADMLIRRAKLLRAVCQVKWCCIALNVFIPVHLARRQFANADLNVVDLKRAQLAKAQSLLHNLEVLNYGLH